MVELVLNIPFWLKHRREYETIGLIFVLIGIHSMQDWTATVRHGVTRKEAQKRLQDTKNLFRKNPQLKDVLILVLKSLRS